MTVACFRIAAQMLLKFAIFVVRQEIREKLPYLSGSKRSYRTTRVALTRVRRARDTEQFATQVPNAFRTSPNTVVTGAWR